MNDVKATDYYLKGSSLTAEELKSVAEQALSRPRDFMSNDADLWVTHTLMFGTPSWNLSNHDIVGETNYRAVLADGLKYFPNDVENFSFGHWTYSRYNCIKVRVLDENGSVTQAFAELYEIKKFLDEQYPVYNDELYSQLAAERFNEYLDSVMETIERDREYANETSTEITLSDKWKEEFRKYVWFDCPETGGSEDHLPDELRDKAIEHADSGWTLEQLHKVETLCHRYTAKFRYSDYRRYPDDASMMKGYVEGWIGGQQTTIFVGVEPNGDSHS